MLDKKYDVVAEQPINFKKFVSFEDVIYHSYSLGNYGNQRLPVKKIIVELCLGRSRILHKLCIKMNIINNQKLFL